MEPMELNLDNPIFVVYLNVDGHTRQKAEELIKQYRRFLNYDNVTFWIMAVEDQKTKIELIWKGQKYEIPSNDNSVKTIKKSLTKLVDIISEGLTDDVLKQKLRDFTLDQILENE
jgi:hypothetical protein